MALIKTRINEDIFFNKIYFYFFVDWGMIVGNMCT